MRIDLPGDAWANLRDPAQVPERLRRAVTRLAATFTPAVRKALSDDDDDGSGLGPEDIDAMFALNDVLAVALVDEWSFETPISVDVLGELPGPVYDALLKAVAPMIVDLMPDFGPSPAPDSPTPPSTVSG